MTSVQVEFRCELMCPLPEDYDEIDGNAMVASKRYGCKREVLPNGVILFTFPSLKQLMGFRKCPEHLIAMANTDRFYKTFSTKRLSQ